MLNHTNLSKNNKEFLKVIFYNGFIDATKSSLGIFKIMIPISFLVAILNYLGVISYLSTFLHPIAKLLGLSGQSIIALLSGYLINTYSAIALMISLELSIQEISILSSMILLAHTLPVELSIQKKAGGRMWLLLLIRVGSSIVTGLILNLMLPIDNVFISSTELSVSSPKAFSLLDALQAWLFENVTVIKIFVINLIINVVFKFLIHFHIIDALSNMLKHIMFLFGLSKEAAPYWLVANIIGLIYGAGILITANENETLEKIEVKKLNISICSMHSLIQETANFLALGVSMWILLIPRLITAVVSVWIYKFFIEIKRANGKIITN